MDTGVAAAAARGLAGLIVIPAYNEARTIEAILDEIQQHLPGTQVLVIDDGSRDWTVQIARTRGVQCVRHVTNLGYAAALQTGFLFAERHGFDYVLLVDADGQHDPRYLPEMVRLVESGMDLVVGSRFAGRDRAHVPPIRRLTMRFFEAVARLFTGVRVTDTTSGFKAVRARLYRELTAAHFADFHAELVVYASMRGFRVAEVPVVMRERKVGLSMYTWPRLLLYPSRTLLGVAASATEAIHRKAREASGDDSPRICTFSGNAERA